MGLLPWKDRFYNALLEQLAMGEAVKGVKQAERARSSKLTSAALGSAGSGPLMVRVPFALWSTERIWHVSSTLVTYRRCFNWNLRPKHCWQQASSSSFVGEVNLLHWVPTLMQEHGPTPLKVSLAGRRVPCAHPMLILR